MVSESFPHPSRAFDMHFRLAEMIAGRASSVFFGSMGCRSLRHS